ncbi:MAG TPA: DUF342 domain-containing protein [Firmicutes bacterium]|nr:DUF342 domain-containing protein [Candidatus Fermentithermobacillaceae bacterium]
MEDAKRMEISISGDRMSAFLILPEGGNWQLSKIRQALHARGIVFGISDAAIRTCISGSRNQPCQIAWGLPPHHGSMAKDSVRPRLVFNFGHSKGKPPDTFAAGPGFREEWRKISSRGSVREGGTLAFVRNLEKCSFGITVTGEKVPYFANGPVIKCGDNAIVSKDGKYALATRPGIPYVEKRKPGVLCSIAISGDIGPETGDIAFPGDFMIKGDVLQGFRVSSWGSLSISGNLYGSATCAGNITVKGGIIAPGETVESGGSISARYCENSVVRAFGNILISDSVMHSIVETEQSLIVSQDSGRIVGGLAIAKSGVSAHSIGSAMGIPTVFEIGASPKLRRKYEKIQKEVIAVRGEIQRIKHAGLRRTSENRLQFDNLRLQRMSRHYEDREEELNHMLSTVKDAIDRSQQGYFSAQYVLPGAKVLVGLNEIRFESPERNVNIGVKLDETN